MNTAVIMAAGLGSRFGKHTELMPKGFVEFKGKAMVVRSIETLVSCGITRIIIGTGWHREAYEELAGEMCARYPGLHIECVYSPRYAETNSMYTLYNCREAVGDDDFLLLESDLVFERRAISGLMDCACDSAMLIAPVTKFQDQYYVEMNSRCELVNCSTDKSAVNPSGELVGIHKLSNSFYRTCVAEYSRIVDSHPKLGYEYLLLDVSRKALGLPPAVLAAPGGASDAVSAAGQAPAAPAAAAAPVDSATPAVPSAAAPVVPSAAAPVVHAGSLSPEASSGSLSPVNAPEDRTPMNVLLLEGLQWYEIDDEADLAFAESHVRID